MALRRTILIILAAIAVITFAAFNYQNNAAKKTSTIQTTPEITITT